MIMFAEQLRYLTLISLISFVGCANTPKEDNSNVLMEDVIVEKTTVRSTTQNPKPKSGGGVVISGDNITVGTIIVNSPNANVDNSTKNIVVQQSNSINSDSSINGKLGPSNTKSATIDNKDPAYHTDRDFFRNMDGIVLKIAPFFIFSSISK